MIGLFSEPNLAIVVSLCLVHLYWCPHYVSAHKVPHLRRCRMLEVQEVCLRVLRPVSATPCRYRKICTDLLREVTTLPLNNMIMPIKFMFSRSCGNHYHFSRKWFLSIFPLNTFIFIFLYQDLFVIAYGDQFFSRDQFVYGITTTAELFGVP